MVESWQQYLDHLVMLAARVVQNSVNLSLQYQHAQITYHTKILEMQ